MALDLAAVQRAVLFVCAIGIIVSCVALVYVGLLLRAAAMTLTKDMRMLMTSVAEVTERVVDLEQWRDEP